MATKINAQLSWRLTQGAGFTYVTAANGLELYERDDPCAGIVAVLVGPAETRVGLFAHNDDSGPIQETVWPTAAVDEILAAVSSE